jgi:hypothetical protein
VGCGRSMTRCLGTIARRTCYGIAVPADVKLGDCGTALLGRAMDEIEWETTG